MTTSTVGFIRKENFIEKLVLSPIFWIVLVSFGLLYPIIKSVNRPLPPELPVYYQVPRFSLQNEFGKPFGSQNLKGKVYMATFMFTSCPTTCLGLMKKVQIIQKKVRGLGTKVGILSLTVDPANDTPKTLYKYSRKLKANPRVWSFLTGEQEQIESLLVKGFKVPMGSKIEDTHTEIFDIVHSNKIVLVDQLGRIRGYYSTDAHDMNKLMIDVGLLVNRHNYQSSSI